MKKFILGLLCGITLTASTAVYASDTIQAYLFPVHYMINGQSEQTESEYSTLNYNGHAYVPVRFIAEQLGADVGYDDATKTITIDTKEQTTMETIENKLYSIEVPKDWTVQKQLEVALMFTKDGKEIGGLDIEGYIPPDTLFFPNHSELVEKKTLDGFFTTVIQANFNRTQPAAALDPTVTREIRYYFLLGDKEQAYDLYFNQDDVDEQTMMSIIKSLKLK